MNLEIFPFVVISLNNVVHRDVLGYAKPYLAEIQRRLLHD